jgi:hypothetical protein
MCNHDLARSNIEEPELEGRTSYLVCKGDGVQQSAGIGFKPDAMAKLRDADISHALERQFGILGRNISQGQIKGVVIGSITILLGKQTVVGRGVGIAIPLASNNQALSIDLVIWVGLER